MNKLFKINALCSFLVIVYISIFSFIGILLINTKIAFSYSTSSSLIIFPTKRPSNLQNLEESVNTIFNMVHKEGGKAVSNIKQTKLMKNETLHTMLLRINFDSDNIIKIISSIQKLPGSKDILKALPTGMRVSYSNNSKIIGGALKLRYNKTKDLFIWQNYDYSYNARIVLRPTKFEKTYATGSIKSSFYKSAIEAGIPENTLFEMVKLLGFSVDFQRDIREGDTFEVLFSKQIDVLDDKVIDTMPMRFLSITLSGKKETFFEFKDKDGYTRYYDEQGKSSIRTLMKTPINGARLSSRYGNRKHPILGYNKMHRGVDFSAPVGTPIFASGDGIIEKAGWNGSYGRYIRIRHNGAYKTAYAHLSGFNKNIKIGQRISQGKVIGYVGSSGRSTGPHLHYEVMLNNRQINPMKVKLPSGKNISKNNLNNFKTHIRKIISDKIALVKQKYTKTFADQKISHNNIKSYLN
ncbi:peptidoglycan DD-metalloendopeptidase family protein [Alphaproteobacteria bacterium]|nr:peptidoglycan DD-metalloendopeptidase family protein [Alphaproteobacteria bacterium]